MQSQLEAALLGHGCGSNQTALDDDERDEHDEEGEDDEFIDEILKTNFLQDCETEVYHRSAKTSASNGGFGKTVTLQMLLSANILQPGDGVMSIEYLGQKFVADLLEDGKIRSQETDIVFASPSAWAIASKRFINPDKKSGCGWASIKYRGRKLDAYKNIWFKQRKNRNCKGVKGEFTEKPSYIMASPRYMQRMVVKHNTIANRTFTHDANTLIECVPFSNLGKIQPFLLSISTNAALLMDFHCHLTSTEVSGYLGGQWDVNAHSLQVTHAFPCRNTKSDRENAAQVELQIAKAMEKQKLLLVGWYHSHAFTAAAPSLRDIDAQLDYQIRMKGLNDSSYTPCIGIIISPYNYENASLESSIISYWVIPPPENKPNEYGRPMLMSYSVIQDTTLTHSIKDEMRKCVEYYRKQKALINFTDKFLNTTSFIEKFKGTLVSKFPQDQTDGSLWTFIRNLVGCSVDEESLLTIPTVNKNSQMLPTLNTPVSLNSNLMLTSDIASVLFNSGKFPSASSLLGLPDPMAHSTLAANNMFLSTNLFKMQDLLKPMTTSSPISSKSKTETKTPLKIPTDIKKMDFTDFNLMSYKNKMDYTTELINMVEAAKKPKTEYSVSDLSISSNPSEGKRDFSISDLSISSNKSMKNDYSGQDLSISNVTNTSGECSLDLSRRDESDASKNERSLDLSGFSIKHLAELSGLPKSLSVTTQSDQPMNLTSSQ